MICYMATTQRTHRIMLKFQPNIASKLATGIQGYTMTKYKHLQSVEVFGASRDASNLKITEHDLPA